MNRDQKRMDLLKPAEAAELLRVGTETLASWRAGGKISLPYTKVGGRILYRRSDLEDYVDSCTVSGGAA